MQMLQNGQKRLFLCMYVSVCEYNNTVTEMTSNATASAKDKSNMAKDYSDVND